MTAELDLETLRTTTPSCTGVALFAGDPLAVVASSGEPTIGGWGSWAEVGEAAAAVLFDAPVACSEVLMRLPAALLLVEARRGGVVAVLIELSKAGAGVALVQARVTASKVAVGGAVEGRPEGRPEGKANGKAAP
jgi:hypothetical protein